MSRNSKQARLHREARDNKRVSFTGKGHVQARNPGPSATIPTHGKKRVNRIYNKKKKDAIQSEE